MSEGYQIYNQEGLYFLTFQIVEWVDIFTRPANKIIVTDCFDFCRKNKGLELFAYVIMTNHIHLIARAKDGFKLSDIIRDFKKFTANQLLTQVQLPEESRSEWMLKRFSIAAAMHKRNSNYQIWTQENHAEEIHTNEFFQQKLNYIHQNPVRAKIVDEDYQYTFSSAKNYSELPAVIEIDYYR